ncbi:Hypothetical predicted protein, partial [Pelobates cultripes]
MTLCTCDRVVKVDQLTVTTALRQLAAETGEEGKYPGNLERLKTRTSKHSKGRQTYADIYEVIMIPLYQYGSNSHELCALYVFIVNASATK